MLFLFAGRIEIITTLGDIPGKGFRILMQGQPARHPYASSRIAQHNSEKLYLEKWGRYRTLPYIVL